jgi:NitT/TauT family transport system substrate-binding protein
VTHEEGVGVRKSTERRARSRGLAVAVAAAIAAAGVVAGCGSDSSSDKAASGGSSGSSGGVKQAELVLPFPPNINYVAGTNAADQFFKKQGVSVKFQSVDGSPIVVQQIVAGKAKYGISATAAVIAANARGATLRGIAVNRHDASAVLSVIDDSPVQSVADLKGKNVGIPSLSDGSVPLVTAALNDAGLKVGHDVRLVVVGEGGPAVASALKTNRIAAYSAGVSDQPGLIVKGGVQLRSIMPPKYAGLPDTVFVTTKAVLEDPAQRDVAIRMARALEEGAEYAKANPDKTVQAGCRLYPDQCQDKQFAQVAVEKGVASDSAIDGTKYGFMDPAKMQVYVDAMKASGQVPKDVSVADTFPNDYIEQINQDGS